MRLILCFLLCVFLAAFGILVWNKRGEWFPEKPEPDAAQYETLVESLAGHRQELASRWRSGGAEEKKAVLRETRYLLEMALARMARCWVGTPWDFNGMAEKPGEGEIACGYFVATVLRDAGFRIDRVKTAQLPSESIIRSFLPREQTRVSSGLAYGAFLDRLAESGEGVHLVGLDTHVGFLFVNAPPGATGWAFLHASASDPWAVVEQGKEEADAIRKSRYRVTGNLTAHEPFLVRWLEEAPSP